ncbi:hypothetical protein SERLA73DRAFT_74422 [Serpula lacrymans var. lacrymans S7.3]|uniref:Enoyl reductase (ER) domain-containing protein n=2 Tax=Serpula lacrymans var. lacrymans TaxID=341189 RepID=F8Q1L6_SERL3|nr:uncharacterized protein SERLADRAFT_439077 [Serpula lacrymans var. lacrymans S7.9]EGN98194.1 hypothetical protein SERLA73DRAFT_74422 [Serpula lacrymans var. lacrymans S7.3]EGO23771.1 hypothetical protein SERLADRAFT_439077 [Serpula lacrymans var. lacrymans S7.9]
MSDPYRSLSLSLIVSLQTPEMAPIKNGRLLFNAVPQGYPVPGQTTVYDDSEKIDLDNVPLHGGFLLKTLVLSIDPYIRGRMRDVSSYPLAYKLGKPVISHGVGIVVRSEDATVKAGDHIYGYLDFAEYSVKPNMQGFKVLKNEEKLPWSVYVGIAGMPGQTAYTAWKEYADAKKVSLLSLPPIFSHRCSPLTEGETVFVTTGGGPVGSFVIQLAKADGLNVIASAGSDEKVKFMKEIGADVAFNYKTTPVADVLKKEGPIDIYWDNVGGETLEAAINAASTGARLIECGMSSDYNNNVPYHVKNLFYIIPKSLKVYGFTVSTLLEKYVAAFYEEVPKKLASGEIKYTEDVTQGLEGAGEAILAVLKGTNTGKKVILVAQE